jgi:hypothetical protein
MVFDALSETALTRRFSGTRGFDLKGTYINYGV